MVRKANKEMSTDNRKTAFRILWDQQENGRPGRGSVPRIAAEFNVDRRTIERLWRTHKNKIDEYVNNHNGAPVDEGDIRNLINDLTFYESGRHLSGRKMKWDITALKGEVKAMPLTNRQNFVMLSRNIAVPRTTLQRMKKDGHFRRHTSSLKPYLTEENKVARIIYALDEVDGATHVGGVGTAGDGIVRFKDMFDRVDIDEKWFFQTTDGKTYIMTAGEVDDDGEEVTEKEPHRTISHKNHITKVMFLCAQARPRFNPDGTEIWDGKIGLWPIGEFLPAQRTSAHRPAGTPVWHDHTITKDKYRDLLLTKVFPAIKQKWPRDDWERANCIIRVQQDGAKSHVDPTDPLLLQGLQELEIENKVLLYTQPANSPDVNINDLGFFRALQSEYYKSTPGNAREIIQCVQQAYVAYNSNKINRIWLSLMSCLNEIVEHHGDNNYKIPHIGKERLERIGELPIALPVCEVAVQYFT